MSTEIKPKPSKPILCAECGEIFTTNPALAGCLCPACSKPLTNEVYLSRRREQRGDRGDVGPDELQARFLEATRRHLGGR
jgi:predicted amidophosphoribosyltransferase